MHSHPQADSPAGTSDSDNPAVEAFIKRWADSGASERANYQSFLRELCTLLDVPQHDPHRPDDEDNAYIFERRVRMTRGDGESSYGYIDFYRRGCFVCETKQGVEAEEAESLSEARRERQARRRKGHGVRGTAAWDEVMVKARHQADRYARALPATEGRPPFLMIVDVGHCIELYSEFTRSGAVYTPFPDARSHRIFLNDLRRPELRDRLRRLWLDPLSLDPARRTAEVTREVAAKLAALARSLETDGHKPQFAAYFLMRCIFTMFAEDVELLPKGAFGNMLKSLRGQVHVVPSMLEQLWKAMDRGEFFPVIGFRNKLLRFNGGLFREQKALAITDDQLELLIEAAKADWSNVEPAIFGTLLERALDPAERHKLGAHYTPRAYVERLVLPTVIEPLRADWQAVQAAAAQLANEGKEKKALAEIEKFHRQLCHTRVLDPACGTGNFLYVTLEHLKRLEGEVLDTLERFGGNRSLEMDTATVRPGQMFGIEINPRAAVIAELVLWIGYLQWHLRTAGDVKTVSEPVLEDAKNIETRDAILTYDSKQMVTDESGRPKTHWDGRTTKPHSVTGRPVPDESAQLPIYTYENPRPAQWPKADFIVGNPPFIGASRMRDALGDGYVEALRKTIKTVPESADYVMYWWHHAAGLVRADHVRRFGFVTTNSLRQTFNRRVIETQLKGAHASSVSPPHNQEPRTGNQEPEIQLSLVFAIPDHPWVDDVEAAAVRVAMTVGEASNASGLLQTVESEEPGDESYKVTFKQRVGRILADLTIGVDFSNVSALQSNDGLCHEGLKPHGKGFIISPDEAQDLGLGRIPGLEQHIKYYRNGRDLAANPRNVMIIDLFGLPADEVRQSYPEVYQWVWDRVKPERDAKAHTKDGAAYAKKWWIHGKPRGQLREALKDVPRYLATVKTSKHRFFQFLPIEDLPDSKLVVFASDDAFTMGVLSSRIHVSWALTTGGHLGVGNDPTYVKSKSFDAFPFPTCTEAQIARIRELGEALDAHRKSRQAAHSDLTMTGMYNVLEKLRSGDSLTAKEKLIHEQGLVSIIKQLHDDLDTAVLDAYGWSDLQDDMPAVASAKEEEILTRLVALNHERAEEEKRGLIRWLRPEYQAKGRKSEVGDQESEQQELTAVTAKKKASTQKRLWPKTLPEQVRVLRQTLEAQTEPVDPAVLAKAFRGARKERVEMLLETLQALGHANEIEKGRYSA